MAFTTETLRAFLAVLDHGSFSAAARALHRVPSAISMTIAGLEAELALDLFDRSGREPKPTEAARAIEPRARALAAQFRELEAQALALSEGLERRLTLAVSPELSVSGWAEALAVVGREYPLLEVEVLSAPQADALAMVHSGQANLALVFERNGQSDTEAFHEIGRETLVIVAGPGHRFAAGDPVTDQDLRRERQVAVAGRAGRYVDPRLIWSRLIWRTDGYLTALELVRAGLGWAYLPEALVTPLLQQGKLVKPRLAHMTNECSLWVDLVWATDRPLGLAARRYIAVLTARSTASQ
jgi:DNA-binding transcriptional LysR family regulator